MKRWYWLLALVVLWFGADVKATTKFPIAELGQCRDQRECALFCDVPANTAACWSYHLYQTDAGLVLAETDPATATTPTTVFPIAELGQCADVTACKTYCDQPANRAACRAYGETHGLTRASTNYGQQTALLAHAKQALGCVSLQQCRAYCDEPANAAQCDALAAQYGPTKYRLSREELLNQASATLGCTTMAECHTWCADATHAEQCQAFTEQHAPLHFRRKLHDSSRHRADQPPLPCTTLEACQDYCRDPANATACTLSGEGNRFKINLQQGPNFTCATAAECERYCQANPPACPTYNKSKDYQRFKLQQQLRTQAGQRPVYDSQSLEKYRASLIVPSATPTN